MSVKKWEMNMCCSMQIESLHKQLLECRHEGRKKDISLCPDIMAAPHDETLFDGLMLYIRSIDNGKIQVSGTVFYWSPPKGYWDKSAVICTFDNIDVCIDWLSKKSTASEEGTEVLYEKCS